MKGVFYENTVVLYICLLDSLGEDYTHSNDKWGLCVCVWSIGVESLCSR